MRIKTFEETLKPTLILALPVAFLLAFLISKVTSLTVVFNTPKSMWINIYYGSMILFIMLCVYLIRLYLEGLHPKTSNFSKSVEFNSKINKFKRAFCIFVVLLCGNGISVIEKLADKDLQTISTIELLPSYSLLLFGVLLGVLTFPEWIVDYGESKDIDGFSQTIKIV